MANNGKTDEPKGAPEAPEKKTQHRDRKRTEQDEPRTLWDPTFEEQGASEKEGRQSPGLNGGEPKTTDGQTPSPIAGITPEPFPIVAIGASAGGLEALEEFFRAVPEDSGLAFVVVTHTDPEHESMLPGLLRRKSRIPVRLIEEGMAAGPDNVYLPPSNRDPVISSGLFSLLPRPARPDIHMPVDLFLKHLAHERGESAACVILSGTGTDGTQGLRLIKEKAGLAVAQSPTSARHPGMPKSAMDTGLVDYVLDPAEMPRRLIQYFKHPAALGNPSEDKGEDPAFLRRILAFLANRTQNDFSSYKENTLIRRIERRMTITRSPNASEYLGLLHADPQEVRALFQDLLIGVTSFFRDPEAFDYLKQQVLPALLSRSNSEEFRVWIPGCATGEEAYSVAIVMAECLEEKALHRQVQIFGTDIDPRAIEKARQGAYVQNIASDVSLERLKRFFTKEDNRYRVRAHIRELTVFAEQNILADPPFSKLDLLVCRNLLIYLKPDAQSRLIPLFHYAVRSEGILFLGSSECVGRYMDLFEPVSKQHSIYRRKNHVVHPMVQFPTATRLEREPETPETGEPPQRAVHNIRSTVEKMLMEAHTPACVLVNQEGEIIHFHGRTGKYLEHAEGDPSLRIGDMAREGLRFALLSALRRVGGQKTEIRERGVRVKTNHEYQLIDLVVRGLREPPFRNCRLVVFEERPEPAVSEKQPDDRRPSEAMAELEEELMRVRQDYRSATEELQASNEELRSANEELHSSNEELQSTNEELESSREELQSLNEELNTVNSELHSKVGELRDAYNAINAVLNSTRIAIVFLDTDLRITRFTPEATQLLNLIDSDAGRPIEHISHNLGYSDLSEKTGRVLRDLTSIDEEVYTKDGRCYRMRIMVYRAEEHVIEGVVLTFVNIDAQKQAQKALKEMSENALSEARRFAEDIVDTIRESLLVLDRSMRVARANRSFYDTFCTHPGQTVGESLFELGNGQWNIPALRNLLEQIIEHHTSFEGYRVAHRFPEIGFKKMVLNARMLRGAERKEEQILLAIEDVTGTATSAQEDNPW